MEQNKFTAEKALEVIDNNNALRSAWLHEEEGMNRDELHKKYRDFVAHVNDESRWIDPRLKELAELIGAGDKIDDFITDPRNKQNQLYALEEVNFKIEFSELSAYKNLIMSRLFWNQQKDVIEKYANLDTEDKSRGIK